MPIVKITAEEAEKKLNEFENKISIAKKAIESGRKQEQKLQRLERQVFPFRQIMALVGNAKGKIRVGEYEVIVDEDKEVTENGGFDTGN